MSPYPFQTHLLKYLCDGIAPCRSGRERQVHYSELRAETLCRLAGNELTRPCNLERRTLYHFGKLSEIGMRNGLYGMLNNART